MRLPFLFLATCARFFADLPDGRPKWSGKVASPP